MSELQIALIAFGGVLVAAVWGYNVWQEKRYRRRAESILPAKDAATPDVLMAGREASSESTPAAIPDHAARSEPAFGDSAVLREPTFLSPEPMSPLASTPSAASGSSDSSLPSEQSVDPVKPVAPMPVEWSDGRADCLLRIEFPDPVSVAALWADQGEWACRIDKPMQWLGFDAESGRWRALSPQDACPVSQLGAALQLTDRKGPVSDKSLADFVDGVHQLARRYAGLVELPDQAAVLQRAQALDAFCASVDLQLALHVQPRQGSLTELVGARLRPEIDTAGLRLEGGRYVAVDADDAEVFALTCQAAGAFSPAQIDTARLTALVFTLDVPRVANGAAGFDRMIACARRCAEALGGQLVDAHRKPLPETTAAAIRQRIDELQATMAAHGIPAGGVRALRLFA